MQKPQPPTYDALLIDQLPIGIPDGPIFSGARITCDYCCKELPFETARGKAVMPTQKVITIEAAAHCDSCEQTTFMHWRIYHDFRVEALDNGRWNQLAGPKSFPEKLWRSIQFHYLRPLKNFLGLR